jgi:hypothetical protein
MGKASGTTHSFLLVALIVSFVVSIDAFTGTKRPTFVPDVLGPWIVKFKDGHVHADVTRSINDLLDRAHPERSEADSFAITHSYHRVLSGVAVHGITQEDLLKLEGVERVQADMPRYKTETEYSWGIDRIDQRSLPLDSYWPGGDYKVPYDPAYDGRGVDIYILDTGIDTTHVEFADNGSGRTVANIKTYYSPFDNNAENNDGEGHGTHIAAIAGGNTVGVAKGANLYGIKVMSNAYYGDGWSKYIIDALDTVLARHTSTPGARSVVSLSYSGLCADTYCKNDIELDAVATLVAAGVVVTVAAGDDFWNACQMNPSGAVGAITVASSEITDSASKTSNFGECVDVYAPGYDIPSAESSSTSTPTGCTDCYTSKSGTSMATPFVAGVAAQLLQKNATATPRDVLRAMQCDAVESTLTLDPYDTLSKNLLLQVPKDDGKFGNCFLGGGCENDCSGHGLCAAAHMDASMGSTTEICHCDKGYASSDCSDHPGYDLSWPQTAGGNDCDRVEGLMSVEVTMTADESK